MTGLQLQLGRQTVQCSAYVQGKNIRSNYKRGDAGKAEADGNVSSFAGIWSVPHFTTIPKTVKTFHSKARVSTSLVLKRSTGDPQSQWYLSSAPHWACESQ